jgi:hypothetical protein
MIAFAETCLLVKTSQGEDVPFYSDEIPSEFLGQTAAHADSELLEHAADAVGYYFKNELGVETIPAESFTGALEKVLGGFAAAGARDQAVESSLCQLLDRTGDVGEIFFYSQLRDELKRQLSLNPKVLRFSGLRNCVLRLSGSRRWTRHCDQLRQQIVSFLQECWSVEPERGNSALLVL